MRPLHRLFTLGALVLLSCESLPPATCGQNTTPGPDGICRVPCADATQCLISEVCRSDVCLPPNGDSFEVRLFTIDDASPEFGGTIEVEYAVIGADDIQLIDRRNTNEQVVADLPEAVGSYTYSNIVESGALVLRAHKGGRAPIEMSRPYEVPSTNPVPRITQFFATPTVPQAGDLFQLTWATEAATQVRVTQDSNILPTDGAQNGVIQVSAATDTLFEITATNGQSMAREMLLVTFVPGAALKVVDFQAITHDSIRPGDSFALTWVTEGADRIEVYENSLLVYETRAPMKVGRGAWIVAPVADATFILRAYQGLEEEESDAISVQVRQRPPPAFASVTANPDVTMEGSNSVLVEWDVMPAGVPVKVTDLATNRMLTPSGSAALSTFNGPAGRTYRVHAANERGAETRFVSTLEPITLADGASVDVGNRQVTGTLQANAGVFTAKELSLGVESRGFVRITEVAPCTQGIELALFMNANQIAASSPTGGCASVIAPDVLPGSYRVRVSSNRTAVLGVEFTIRVETVPAFICGNGTTDGNESCDDGNQLNGDGCSATCGDDPSPVYSVLSTLTAPLPPRGPIVQFERVRPQSDPLDDGFEVVPLPFAFTFYGQRHSAMVVHTNGYIGFYPDFRTGTADVTQPIGQQVPNGVIAAFAGNLEVPSNPMLGSVELIMRPQMSDAVRVHWRNINVVGMADARLDATVTLRENGTLAIAYHNLEFGPPVKLQAGVENRVASAFAAVPSCERGCGAPDPIVGRTFEFAPGQTIDPN